MNPSQSAPLISVIIPVYRAEFFLARCVDSLLGQTYQNIELILVDDGSPDGSGAICDLYAAADKRVRVCHQQNAGASAARNTGLSMATGEFLCFVDGDDEVEPGYIRAFVEGLAPEVDLVFQGICEIRDGQSTRKVPPRRLFKEGELTEAIALINKQSMFGYVCNKLYRRSIIEEHGLRFRRDISLSEDRIFALEYMLHTRQMQLVDVCAYQYYLRGSGQTLRHRCYQELKTAADANLQAALALLQKQPSEPFTRDTRRMYVMCATGYLAALFRDKAPTGQCIRAFHEFHVLAQDWLPLYNPPTLDAKALCHALRWPAPLGVLFMKIFRYLKLLKHEIFA